MATLPHTGQFRVRKGLFGKSILQELINYPSFLGGSVDASLRTFVWEDVEYKYAPRALLIKRAAPKECNIQIYGDSTECRTCFLRWDTNDSHPPECPL